MILEQMYLDKKRLIEEKSILNERYNYLNKASKNANEMYQFSAVKIRGCASDCYENITSAVVGISNYESLYSGVEKISKINTTHIYSRLYSEMKRISERIYEINAQISSLDFNIKSKEDEIKSENISEDE